MRDVKGQSLLPILLCHSLIRHSREHVLLRRSLSSILIVLDHVASEFPRERRKSKCTSRRSAYQYATVYEREEEGQVKVSSSATSSIAVRSPTRSAAKFRVSCTMRDRPAKVGTDLGLRKQLRRSSSNLRQIDTLTCFSLLQPISTSRLHTSPSWQTSK